MEDNPKKVDIEESATYENFIGKKEVLDKEQTLSSFLDIEADESEESDREKLWVGMPEFEQKDKPTYKTIYLHFRNEEDFREFVKKYKTLDDEQTISDKTKSMWYPHLAKDENSLKRWFEEE